MTEQDVLNAITEAEAAGVTIEAIGAQVGKISKEELLHLIKGACGKFEMDQAKLDALLKHIVETFKLSKKDQKKIIEFLEKTLNITLKEFTNAKKMCFEVGKEAKAAREAAAN